MSINTYDPIQKVLNQTAGTSSTIQMATLPTADSTNLGKIYQYAGATNENYTNGYFYKCVSDGETPPTYSWVPVPTQEAITESELKTELRKSIPTSSYISGATINVAAIRDTLGNGLYAFHLGGAMSAGLAWMSISSANWVMNGSYSDTNIAYANNTDSADLSGFGITSIGAMYKLATIV